MFESTLSTIRSMEPDDAPQLAHVSHAAGGLFASVGIDLPDDDPAETLREAAWVLVAGRPAVGFAAVVELPGAIAPGWAGEARAMGTGTPTHTTHLEELAVHPDQGRSGVGTALLEAVCAAAAESGRRWVTLTTFRDVAFNGPFYARRGFTELPAEGWGPGMRAKWRAEEEAGIAVAPRIAMRRRLDGDG